MKNKKKSKKINVSIVLLILVLIIGSYLRFSGVLTNSFAFTYDVGRDLLNVASIIHTHKIPLIGATSGLAGLFYGPWWYYILTVIFLIAGGNPQGIDFAMAVLSIAAVALAFFIGRKIADDFFGVVLASFLAVSAAVIGSTNQIWNPDIIPFFLTISVYYFAKLLKNSVLSKRDWFILGFLLGLIIEGEIVFGVLFAIGTVGASIILIRKKLLQWQVLFVVPGVLLVFLPQIFFEMRHQFIETKLLLHLPQQSSGHNQLVDVVSGQAKSFFQLFTDSVGGNNAWISGLILFGIIGILIFCFNKMDAFTRKFFLFCILTVVLFFCATIFIAHAVWGYYLIGLPVVFVLLTSFAIFVWYRFGKYKWVAVIVAIGLFFLNMHPVQVFSQLGKPPFAGDIAVYRNQLAIIDYIYQKANGKAFNYAAYTPVVHDYTYQYLFSWYGKNIYGYVPDIKKQTLFFLIIEPNPQFPDLQKQWLDVRENDGVVVSDTLVKAGVRVQERKH